MRKKLSLFIVFVLLLSLLPAALFADTLSTAVKLSDNEGISEGTVQTYGMKMYNIYLKSGKVFYAQKKYIQAIEKFNTATRYMSDGAEAHYFKGLCYMAMKDYASAMVHFDKAIACDSEYMRVYAGVFGEEYYNNEFLGLSLKLNDDWQVMDMVDLYIMVLQMLQLSEEMNLDEVYEDEVYEDEVYEDEVYEDEVYEDEVYEDEIYEDENYEDEVYETEDDATYEELVSEMSKSILVGYISKYPMDTETEDNALAMLGVVRICEETQITGSKSFAEYFRDNVEVEGFEFGEIQEEKIEGMTFSTASATLEVNGDVGYIKLYATEINGCIFYVYAVYQNEAHLTEIEKMINSIKN